LEALGLSKPLSLLFAVIAVLLFIGIGISLSYRLLWLALLLTVVSVFQIGLGFIIKARLHRKNQP
jgi:hypothetical protein